jgi:hypothetical protein
VPSRGARRSVSTDAEVGELAARFQRFTADFVERGVVGSAALLHCRLV